MRTVGKRSFFLYFIILVFCAGMVFLMIRLFLNGSDWASMPFNAHLYDENDEQRRGSVYDREDSLLYSDAAGYTDSCAQSMLHLLGDREGNISTGAFRLYSAEMSGYNALTGNGREGNLFRTKTRLTVSREANETALEMLAGRNGAVFVYNYRTGEVLCSVSTPSYDPDQIPDEIDTDDAYLGAYLDRTVSDSFTPGSIFKIVTAACAIENLPDWRNWRCTCEGELELGDGAVTCLDHHGEIGIRDGLMYSCNIVFAQLAQELGPEKLTATARALGYGRSFDFESTRTAESFFDVSGAKEDELGWAGVGQYSDRAVPFHMALLMGSVAAGGESAQPYYVENISLISGLPLHTAHQGGANLKIKPETAKILREMLVRNVEEYYGTDLFHGIPAGAKTGTAEVGNGKDDTAWMIGFLQDPDAPYAFAVVVEEGGSGFRTAGRIASSVLGVLLPEE